MGGKIKLTEAQKELLLDLQRGDRLMWSYKNKCFYRHFRRDWTVLIRHSIGDALIQKDLVSYQKDGRHEGEKVAKYELTELGKNLIP